VLVAPYVAAEMTDLLQTAVNTGTGRAAQIGRPVAGKTGTTSSSKDGWFLGFSSGLTTGVWMGRDDARPIAGLHGGTAPARAFAAFMKPATANRPIEQFETQVTLPEWQLEPDEETYYGQPDNGAAMVDEDGNPTALAPRDEQQQDEQSIRPQDSAPQQLDDLIDRVTGRDAPQPRDDRRDPAAPARQPLRDDRRDGAAANRQPPRPLQDDRPTQ
jgi:penicillin-binding protein 1A